MKDILDRVEIDFSTRTVHLYGEEGEYQKIECDFTHEGYEQFMRVVNECQEKLPDKMKTYKV